MQRRPLWARLMVVSGRLFNEKEVREILKRASLSQSQQGLRNADGISLEELQQVGVELGFDPRQIELAAQKMGSPAVRGFGLFNGRIVLESSVEGMVSPDDWQGMVAAVQRYHKGSGAVTQRAGNFDWAGSDEYGSLALTVNTRNNLSRIRLESNRWLEIFMASIFCPVFALVASLSLMKHGHPMAFLPVCLVFASLLFLLIRTFRRSHLQSISGLMERLIQEVQADSVTSVSAAVPVGSSRESEYDYQRVN